MAFGTNTYVPKSVKCTGLSWFAFVSHANKDLITKTVTETDGAGLSL